MNHEVLVIGAVLAPLATALTLPLLGRMSTKVRNLTALAAILSPLILSALLLPAVLDGRIVTVSYPITLGFNLTLTADLLAVFMALASSSISAVIVLFSFDYISHYEYQNEYYLCVVLFLGSMMGICYSSNLIILYIFWEITALTSWRLIGFFRKDEFVLRADKAFLTTVFGALVMLIGFVMLYDQTGSFDLSVIRTNLAGSPIPRAAAVCILAGILSKSATLPFHTWLPDAGVAPSPVTALLHAAVLVKIGVYVYARLFVASFPDDRIIALAVMIIALASTLISAGAAIIETDLKRIIAYSTISQIGFIFLGLASGNTMGITGGLLYILMHGFAKAGLFLSAGIIEQKTGVRDITKLGGLIKTMPVTAVAFLMCAFSVMGVPPFGGFFSKYLVIAGALGSGQVVLAIAFAAAGFLTIVYLFRLANAVFFTNPASPQVLVREGSPLMVACVALLALLSLAGGIAIYLPSHLVDAVVRQMLGGPL